MCDGRADFEGLGFWKAGVEMLAEGLQTQGFGRLLGEQVEEGRQLLHTERPHLVLTPFIN